MNNVRQGYKQTEVGVIPEDWDARKLGELATFRTGPFGSALHKSDYTSDGVPVINPMHIIDGQLVPTSSMTITEAAATKLSEFRLSSGEVIIGRRGDMGRCAVVLNKHLGWLCGTGSMIVRPSPKIDTRFLQRVLSSPSVVSAIVDSSVGTTMVNLNQNTLSSLSVQTPPLPEQRAIATALSDTDALIASLDKLIAKKRDIKQATMQQLLTGKWEVKRLGDVATFLKGKGLPKSELISDGANPCIHYGELFTRYPETIREIFSKTNSSLDTFRSIANDVLMPTSDVTPRGLAKASCVTVDGVILGGDILVIRSDAKRVLGTFLSYIIRCEEDQVLQLVSGSTVYHLYGSDMKKFTFSLPSITEQTAIAAVLSDMDTDLTALENQRSKILALKQGMMQELLTGRIRLV
jgi:type I restriction enzyme S subunit